MSYPFEKTYLERIQENKEECNDIRNAYFVLLNKYCADNHVDDIDLDMKQLMAILGEAIDLRSYAVGNVSDKYHFLWDVLDALFPEDKNDKS